MSALVLRWRRIDAVVVPRWCGPDNALLVRVEDDPATPVAAIIGPPGPAASQAQRIAGEAIGGHRAVAVASDGKAYLVSPADALADAVFGVTSGAAAAGASVLIVCAGEMTEPLWSWTPGPVWLGASGVLTQVLPVSGAIVRIGAAGGPTAIAVEPRLISRI